MWQLEWPTQEVKLPAGFTWRMPAGSLQGKSKSALERMAVKMQSKYGPFRYEIKEIVPAAWRERD